MDAVLPVLVFVSFLAAWWRFLYVRSGRRPLWLAFSATVVAVLFLVSGSIGYTLSRHERFVAETAWADGVIWPQIAAGLIAAAFAGVFWWKGVRTIRSS